MEPSTLLTNTRKLFSVTAHAWWVPSKRLGFLERSVTETRYAGVLPNPALLVSMSAYETKFDSWCHFNAGNLAFPACLPAKPRVAHLRQFELMKFAETYPSSQPS